jgi:hypothetical protein
MKIDLELNYIKMQRNRYNIPKFIQTDDTADIDYDFSIINCIDYYENNFNHRFILINRFIDSRIYGISIIRIGK